MASATPTGCGTGSMRTVATLGLLRDASQACQPVPPAKSTSLQTPARPLATSKTCAARLAAGRWLPYRKLGHENNHIRSHRRSLLDRVSSPCQCSCSMYEGYLVHNVVAPVDPQCTSAEPFAPSSTGSGKTIDDCSAVTMVTSTRSPASPITPNSSSPAAFTKLVCCRSVGAAVVYCSTFAESGMRCCEKPLRRAGVDILLVSPRIA